MRKPKALKPGSHIRVVSPASALTPETTEAGLALLRAEGYHVTLGDHVYDRLGYLAGPDEIRAADLMAAFRDPSVDAVFCSRGGYGCARLFPYIDLDEMAASGKMFCGFSDVTTLHVPMLNRGMAVIHAPMLITLSVEREPWVYESLKRLLRGEDSLDIPGVPRAETLVPGKAEGVLTGGCMILITDTLGTPNPIDAEGKILMLEDVDENPHRVDAMLTQLLNAGVLQSAAGIVVGEMTGTDERRDEKIGAWPWRTIVEDRLKSLNIPTIINFPWGHMKTMLSVPLGVRAQLDADAGTLRLLESPCTD